MCDELHYAPWLSRREGLDATCRYTTKQAALFHRSRRSLLAVVSQEHDNGAITLASADNYLDNASPADDLGNDNIKLVVWDASHIIATGYRRLTICASVSKPPIADAMNSGGSGDDDGHDEAEAGSLAALRKLAPLVAPVTAATALLYFFGYVRQRAFFAYFGLDVGSLGFSTTDYLRGGVQAIFRPVTLLVAILLGAVALHILFVVVFEKASAKTVRRIGWALRLSGGALLIVGVVVLAAAASVGSSPTITPMMLIVGAILLEYAIRAAQAQESGSYVLHVVEETKSVRQGMVIALVTFSAFWSVANIANQAGNRAAEAYANALPLESGVLVYSHDRLAIRGGYGVEVVPVNLEHSAYRFRYSGLRPLLQASDRWFLVSAGWTRTNGQGVIILHDDPDQLRVEIIPGSI
jgi:hypothetical protein